MHLMLVSPEALFAPGRQLDSVPATIDVLPAIAEEVRGEAPVQRRLHGSYIGIMKVLMRIVSKNVYRNYKLM